VKTNEIHGRLAVQYGDRAREKFTNGWKYSRETGRLFLVHFRDGCELENVMRLRNKSFGGQLTDETSSEIKYAGVA
jgi:hypothetical protein